ncbi:MAG: hypothetical protein QG658_315, partial [Patescibacteria group bacterium]|nr:hypothetical protein [Patescibacteria group bacterium]
MIVSTQYSLHRLLVEQLRGQSQSGLEAVCASVSESANVPIEGVYFALGELMTLDIVQFHPTVAVKGEPEPQAAVWIDHVGYDLYRCLAEVSKSTRTLSCGTTMLFIVNACGMATKSQLFQRLYFVKGARRYSYTRLSVLLWALVRTGRLVVRRDESGIPLFDIAREGRHK